MSKNAFLNLVSLVICVALWGAWGLFGFIVSTLVYWIFGTLFDAVTAPRAETPRPPITVTSRAFTVIQGGKR